MAAKKEKKSKPTEPQHQTPSGLARAEVGELPEDASDEEKVEHAQRYLEAKLRARRGS